MVEDPRYLPIRDFRTNTGPGIRITISTLSEAEASEIAAIIGAVEAAGRPRRAY